MSVLKFRKGDIQRQKGERARLKVSRGPDWGAVYVLTSKRATLGRDESNDIVLPDIKASRNHAVIQAERFGWKISDLESANGIVYNGEAARSAKLYSGDQFEIGDTVFEFLTAEENTEMLSAGPRSRDSHLQEVQKEDRLQKRRLSALIRFGDDIPGIGSIGKGEKKVSNFLIAVLLMGAGIGYFLLEEGPSFKKDPVVVKKPEPVARDLAAFLPDDSTDEAKKSADVFFKAGFREFREKNYLRSKTQFETVLQIFPGHRLARIYLENCIQEIEEEVKFHLDRGRKGIEAGKLKASRGHFEAVLRLLRQDPTNPSFVEAKDQLSRIQVRRGRS